MFEAVVQNDALWEITVDPAQAHRPFGGAALGSLLLEFVHPDDIGTMRFRHAGVPPAFRPTWTTAGGVCSSTRNRCGRKRVISRQGVRSRSPGHRAVLVEVRQRFLRLLETDGVVWRLKLAMGNTFLSPQVERLSGYSVEEWRAGPGFGGRHVHPDDLEALHRRAAYNATYSHAPAR